MIGLMSEPDGFTPDEARGNLPASGPPRAASPGHRLGRVAGVTSRIEGRGANMPTETVLGFRLVDPHTSVPVEVELRGRSIAGTVREGDWVEVAGEPARSGRLEPLRVANLTTGSEVSAVGTSRSPVGRVLAVLFVLLFLVVLGFIAYNAYGAFTDPGF